ncbi:MAG: 50S ribosomal protein L18 [Caldisericaceae bacterium]
MIKIISRNESRKIRHKRIRKILKGTSAKPRLSIYISLKQVYAQLIDDENGNTLVSVSTTEKGLKEDLKGKNLTEKAKVVGKLTAERALEKGVNTVVFDRSGYGYHGRVKALAEEARKAGLQF